MTESGIAAGVAWVAALLSGSIATTICIVAVATLGVLMLSGRIPTKRAALVVVGCFIVFGAPVIASALVEQVHSEAITSPSLPSSPVYRPTVPTPTPYDPYAGASVPRTLNDPNSAIIR